MPRTRAKLDEAAGALADARDAVIGEEPAYKKAHGIVHTPPPIARAMARMADEALARIGVEGGLAAQELVVVDPACGPGVFLAAVLDRIATSRRRGVKLVGLDIDARAIAMARGLLEPTCAERGVTLELATRDTLAVDPRSLTQGRAQVLVIGNPPWAARTPLRGQAETEAMLDDFRADVLGERKIGVLSDAYVRFFRFCAEVVRVSPGGGVLALVTNGSYLDGPVHRGMRGALMRWLDTIDVVDLGGSALVAGDGARDENVFGVRPTVAITIASRAPSHGELVAGARVRHARLRGTKDAKLRALEGALAMETITPVAPGFVLRPVTRIGDGAPSIALDAIFPFHREGVQTNRDRAVVARDTPTLLARLARFARGDADPELEPAYAASAHYDPTRARAEVADALARDPDGTLGISAQRLAYRPFDERVYAPIATFCHRPRPELARAIARAALTLVTVRKDRGEAEWLHFGVVRVVPDNCLLSNRSSCRTRAFPSHTADGRENVSEEARARFAACIGRAPSARELVAYALAILASRTYRRASADALRLDYPSLPLPTSAACFDRRVAAGEELASVFLSGRGSDRAKIGHYTIQIAAPGLEEALADADAAFRDDM